VASFRLPTACVIIAENETDKGKEHNEKNGIKIIIWHSKCLLTLEGNDRKMKIAHPASATHMATTCAPAQQCATTEPQQLEFTFREAMSVLSREERFMATVSAMNTLMIQKGIYTTEELEAYYVQWASAQIQRPKSNRPGWGSKFFAWLR
jgi:hypothetical protein